MFYPKLLACSILDALNATVPWFKNNNSSSLASEILYNHSLAPFLLTLPTCSRFVLLSSPDAITPNLMMLCSEIKAILQTNTSLPTINCCISPGKTLHFGKDWDHTHLEFEPYSLYSPTQVGKCICSLPLHHCCKYHRSGMASVAHRV